MLLCGFVMVCLLAKISIMKKVLQIAGVLFGAYLVFIIGFSIHESKQREEFVIEMGAHLKAISYPAYMDADFSDFSNTGCSLDNCTQAARYTYPSGTSDSKAWNDFSVLLKRKQFSEIVTNDNYGDDSLARYTAHYKGNEKQCATIVITQEKEKNLFTFSCR